MEPEKAFGEAMWAFGLVIVRLVVTFGPACFVAWYVLAAQGWSVAPFGVGALWMLGLFAWAGVVYRYIFRVRKDDRLGYGPRR